MPGFFQSLGRLFKGEPVFDPQDDGNKTVQRSGDPTQSSPQTPLGPKELPQVMFERWQPTENGAGLHCEFLIRNYSRQHIVLDRIEILGVRDQLEEDLLPGGQYEYVLDMSKRPINTNDSQCRLYFKNIDGDYFCAIHLVEFKKLPDNTYNILRFRFLPPIRDV